MRQEVDIKDLGRKIKERDEEAFRFLYVEYFHNLQSYAMRYLYDWEEAETSYKMLFSLYGVTYINMMRNVISSPICLLYPECLSEIYSGSENTRSSSKQSN